MFKVLLVEDLEECQLIVKRALASAPIELVIASTVKETLALLKSDLIFNFNLVILDLGLPDGEGFSILEEIRARAGNKIPVFLLTSHAELDSKVTAFNLGADDYLIKPISGIELRARVEMRLKKSSHQQLGKNILAKGDLRLDLSLLRASLTTGKEQKALTLTHKEFKILALLMQNEGKVYSRQDLVKMVWGDEIHVLERTVDSHIFGLRKKLTTCSNYVECIPNVGYRFLSPAPEVAKSSV